MLQLAQHQLSISASFGGYLLFYSILTLDLIYRLAPAPAARSLGS